MTRMLVCPECEPAYRNGCNGEKDYRAMRGLARRPDDLSVFVLFVDWHTSYIRSCAENLHCDLCNRAMPNGFPCTTYTFWEQGEGPPKIWEDNFIQLVPNDEWQRVIDQIKVATAALIGA